MNYDRWIETQLTYTSLSIRGHRTGVWMTDSSKPLAILVHGITGDFHGLVPLAHELAATHRIAIVELPGHGSSDEIADLTGRRLQKWFVEVVEKLAQMATRPEVIVAHSFGCLSVLHETILTDFPVVLLNPVPTPSDTYNRYARSVIRSARFWAFVYNWRVLIFFRTVALVKLRNKLSIRRVHWVGRTSKPEYHQVIYQAHLVDMILSKRNFVDIEDKVALVMCGLYDTTARQRDSFDFEAIFGRTPIVFIRGGHLLPIEDPVRVAEVIQSVTAVSATLEIHGSVASQ